MEELASDLQASIDNSKHLEKQCTELQSKVRSKNKDTGKTSRTLFIKSVLINI
jgi:hypothetical protein